MKKFLILVAASALVTVAQEKAGPVPPTPLSPGEVIHVVEVKQGSAASIQSNLGAIFPGISRVNEQLIVRGQPAVVEMVEAAIKKLDIPSGEIVRVIELKNADGREVSQALSLAFGRNLSWTKDTVIVQGQPEMVGKAEAAIKALDVPTPNVELTVQLLRGSNGDQGDAKIPTDLEATVRQLRGVFAYKNYRLLETQVLRARSNDRNQRVEASGSLPGGDTRFQFSTVASVKPGAAPRLVHLDSLNLDIRFPVMTDSKTIQYANAGINASLDVREGQKTVIGKANILNSEDALILVITPKIE